MITYVFLILNMQLRVISQSLPFQASKLLVVESFAEDGVPVQEEDPGIE